MLCTVVLMMLRNVEIQIMVLQYVCVCGRLVIQAGFHSIRNGHTNPSKGFSQYANRQQLCIHTCNHFRMKKKKVTYFTHVPCRHPRRSWRWRRGSRPWTSCDSALAAPAGSTRSWTSSSWLVWCRTKWALERSGNDNKEEMPKNKESWGYRKRFTAWISTW